MFFYILQQQNITATLIFLAVNEQRKLPQQMSPQFLQHVLLIPNFVYSFCFFFHVVDHNEMFTTKLFSDSYS